MITHEDIQEIKRVLDDRYVLRQDCDARQGNINSKLANDDKRIDLILVEQKTMRAETKKGLQFNNWLTFAILGVIVSCVIAYYVMGGN